MIAIIDSEHFPLKMDEELGSLRNSSNVAQYLEDALLGFHDTKILDIRKEYGRLGVELINATYSGEVNGIEGIIGGLRNMMCKLNTETMTQYPCIFKEISIPMQYGFNMLYMKLENNSNAKLEQTMLLEIMKRANETVEMLTEIAKARTTNVE